jgi:hypothetical protein
MTSSSYWCTYCRNKPVKITLKVHYTDDYPNTIPSLSLEPTETEFSEEEIDELLSELRNVVRWEI